MPKISELNELTALTADDLLLVVDDPGGGTPTSRKVTTATLGASVAASFDSHADAITATISASYDAITTRGYATAGDGGGALYKRISTPTPVEAWHFQSADGAYWELVPHNGIVNVRCLGAVGDGVTNDTTAIQNALDFGNVVFIPEGSYVVSSTLNYYTQQHIFGVGDKSEIKSSISGGNVLENSGIVYNVNLHDFRIAGGGSETGGIRVTQGYEGMRLSRIIASSVGGKAFWFTGIFVVDCYDLWSEGNNVTEFGVHLDNVTNFNFFGCHFRESISTGAGARIIRVTAESYKVNFYGCIFEANYGDGIQIQAGNVITIDECYFEANNYEYNTDSGARANHISLTDLDGLGTNNAYVKISGCYFNENYVEHLVESTVAVEPLVLENNLDQNFGSYGFQTVRYNLDLGVTANTLAYLNGINATSVDTNSATNSLLATNYRGALQDDVRLVYYNSGGTAVEGDVSATIVSTRTMQAGAIKTCVFDIGSIDVSALDTNRLIAIIPPVGRFSVGYFSAPIEHVGTSATSVLQFYLVSESVTENFMLKKLRATAGGSTSGRAGDLDGVTSLRGSITYF